MSLANTILHGTKHDVANFVANGAELDVIDEYGYTPLIETAIVDDIEKAQVLLDAGADVNFLDLTHRSALHWSVDNENIDLTELLLEKKADPNSYTSAGQPVLVMPLLREQKALKNLLCQYGANVSFAQDFINAKLLAHRFLLRGRVDIVSPKQSLIEIDYEGFYLESTLAFLLNSLKDYLHHFQARRVRDYFNEINKVIRSLQNATQLIKYQHYKINTDQHREEIHALLDEPLLILPVAYEGHAITLVKYGSLFIRCDRGEYGKIHGTIIIYRITNHAALSKDFLMSLMYQPLSKRFVTQDLQKIAGLETLFTLPLAPQTSGNCSWANVEAAMLAGIFLLLVENMPSLEQVHINEAQEQAFFVYDEWLRWDRDRALDFCIDSFNEASDLRKLTKAAILVSIFVQQCRYDDLHDLDRAKRLLPIIAHPRYSYILKTYIDVFKQTDNRDVLEKIEEYLDDFGIVL